MAYTWLSFSSKTGLVIEELADLDVKKVKSQLMAYTTTTATLPLPTAPENWRRATLPGGAVLLLLDGEQPVWAGMVTKATPDHTDTLPISLLTIEGYFDRRFVGDRSYTQVPQNLIMKDLVERYAAAGVNGGIPIRVEIVGGNGAPRDRAYEDRDDKTLYSILKELSGVIDGPEWTVRVEQLSAVGGVQRYGFVFTVGDRIGATVMPGLAPAATFELPGSVTDFHAPHDYSVGKGANSVMAVSSAEADERPQSPPQVVPDPERPTFELRFTPSTSIKDIGTLVSHAQAKARAVAGGSKAVQLKANALAYPRLGTDWVTGDDIGFSIGGTVPARGGRPSYEIAPAYPGGLRGVVRAVGWELELTGNPEVVPVLLGDDLEDS